MLSRRQRLAGTAIFSLTLAVLLTDRAALADCSAVGDVVTCDNVGAENSPFNAGAGNNTIDIISGTYANAINGNTGDDIFNASGGQVGAINGDQDNDIINLTGTSVTGNVSGGAGDDGIVLDGSTVDGGINGGSGSDVIDLLDGQAGSVNGGVGIDIITLDGATIVGDILGGADNDVIDLTSGSVGGDVLGEVGDDLITLDGATVGGSIFGEDGDDGILLLGGSVAGNVEGDAGNDLIVLDGASVGGNLAGDDGNDVIDLLDGQAGNVSGGNGDDLITLDGATVVVIGGAGGNDTIDLLSGQSGNVFGGLGDDIITLDGATVSGIIAEDGNDTINLVSGQSDSVTAGGGTDLITLDDAVVNGFIQGNAGDDEIELNGGTVTGDVDGGDDNDDIAVLGASIGGDVLGGAGDDFLGVGDGSVAGSLLAGDGNDSMILAGGEVGGNLQGEAGDDFVLLQGGSLVGNAEGGIGDDTVVLIGGEVGGNVDGGDDDDLIGVFSGSVAGDVLGGLGDDQIVIGQPDGTGDASIGGNVDGGDDDDLMLFTAAEAVDGSVLGGAGEDAAVFFGSQMTETIPIMLGGMSVDFTGGSFDDQLGNLASLEGGDDLDVLAFVGIDGGLPATVTGWEIIALVDNTTLNVHQNTDDMTFVDNLILQIDDTSTLIAAGQSPGVLNIPGDVFNAGTMTMVDGEANDRINIGGNYSGAGGSVLAFDAALDASEVADFVSIGGNVSGTSAVEVNDIGNGIGALTGNGPGNGIAVIEVGGTTTDTNFALSGGPIQVGVFDYDLNLESDNVWYLQSELLAQGYVYGALPGAMLSAQKTIMGSLYERVGDVRQVLGGAQLNEDPLWLGGASGVWVRGLGNWAKHEGSLKVGNSSIDTSYKQDLAGVQVGADFDLTGNLGLGADEGSVVLGISGIYAKTWVHADDENGDKVADWDSNIYGLGVTGTWYLPMGLYADLTGQVLWYDGTVSTVAEGDKADVDGFGWGIGGEVGYAIPVTRHVQVVPNGQLTYQHVNFDDFTDADGVKVSRDEGQSLEGRLGVIVEAAMRPGRGAWFTTYVEGNIVHEFLDASSVDAAGTTLGYDMKGTAAEVGIGASVRVIPSLSFYAEVDYQIPFDSDDGTRALQATGGLRFAF